VERYSGNPLVLKLVAQTIQELFAGNVGAFLRNETPIFDDIRDVLDQQFARHALNRAQAREYVRQSQVRQILAPIAEQLGARIRQTGLVELLRKLPDSLRGHARLVSSNAAGNALNLLIAIGADLRRLDFSDLAVWQASLRGVVAPEMNFAHADLSGSSFAVTFDPRMPSPSARMDSCWSWGATTAPSAGTGWPTASSRGPPPAMRCLCRRSPLIKTASCWPAPAKTTQCEYGMSRAGVFYNDRPLVAPRLSMVPLPG